MKGVTNYLRNITKSVAYAAADVSKNELMPNIGEFTSTNTDFINAAYKTFKNPSAAIKSGVESITKSKIYEAVDYGAKNLFEDLRTGNFYNKEREDRDAAKLAGLDADSFGDLSEFGIDDDWEENLNNKSETKLSDEVTSGDLKIVESVENSNAAMANATVTAVVASADANMKSARINTGLLFDQNERLFGNLTNRVSALNSTTEAIFKLTSASLQNIDKNMSSYFTESLKLDTERNAILKEMLEMQRNTYKTAAQKEQEDLEKRKKSGKLRWSDINDNGMVNFENYVELIKSNVKNKVNNATGISGFSEDSNMLASMMTSPLRAVVNGVVSSVIPATMKLAMQEVDKSVSGVFGTVLARMANAKDKDANSIGGGILKFLSGFLGVNTGVSRTVDTSRYEKGAVPFDGITRKAITEIIPTYLRRIDASVSGREEQVFDYKTGKWNGVSGLKKQFEDVKKSSINQATADLMREMKKSLDNLKDTAGVGEKEEIEKAIEQFKEFLYDNNGQINPYKSASENGVDYNYMQFQKYFKPIMEIFRDMDYDNKTGRHVRYSTKMNLGANVLAAKESEEKTYRNFEKDPESIMGLLFNGLKVNTNGKFDSKGKFVANNNLLDTKDKLGHNLFDYLQEITKEIKYVRMNGITGGSGRHNNRSNVRINTDDIGFSLDNDFFKSTNSDTRDFKNKQKIAENVQKKIEHAVQSGKGPALKDFSENEQMYLAGLKESVSNNATDEYDKQVKALIEKNSLTKWLDKVSYHSRSFKKEKNKDLEDVDKALKENDESTDDDKEPSTVEGIVDRLRKGRDFVGGIVAAPAKAFTNLLYTADKAIYHMFFKEDIKDDKDKEESNGVIDFITKKITKKFDETFETIKRDVIKPFKDALGIGDDFKDRFKNSLSDIGKSLGDKFVNANKDVWGPGLNYVKTQFGLTDSETAIQRKRRNKREDTINNINNVQKANNLVDDDFIKLMGDYGLNYVNYNDIETAKKDLMPLLYKDFADNTNNMTEYSGFKDLHTVIDYIQKYSKNPIQDLQKFAKSNNIKLTGKDLPELTEDFKSQMFTDANKKSRHASMYDLARENGVTRDMNLGAIKDLLSKSENISEEELSKLQSRDDAIKLLLKDKGYKGSFANGTPDGMPVTGLSTLSKNETVFDDNGIHLVKKTGLYNLNNAQVLNSVDSDILRGKKPTSTIERDMRNETNLKNKILQNAAGSIAVNAEGSLNIKKAAESIDLDEIKDNAKKYLPEGLAGGLVGGIVSTLFGVVGGPLIGAAVGAAGGIINSSDSLKEKLFGELGKDGKREGGIVSKTVIDTVSRYVPDMAKYGLAGIIPGLLTPLGPIGGLMVGGAVGFLKNNQSFKEKYFGKDGKLKLDSDTTNVVKKFLPNTAKGAAVGTIAGTILGGPFGILGNAALGAAVGLMTSTDEFKDGILGKSINGAREGGLIGYMKTAFDPLTKAFVNIKDTLIETVDKNIVDPIARFAEPAIHALPQVAAIIPRWINNKFDEHFGKGLDGMLKDLFVNPLTTLTSKIIKPIVTMPLKAVTAPIRLLGTAGDAIRKRQINTNNADWMGAEGRNQFRFDHNMEADNLDIALSTVGKKGGLSIEDAEKLRDSMASAVDSIDSISSAKQNTKKSINDRLEGLNVDGLSLRGKTKDKVREALLAGDIDRAQKVLVGSRLRGSRRTLTEEEANNLLTGTDDKNNSLATDMHKYLNLQERAKSVKDLTKETKDAAFNQARDTLNSLGVDTSKLNKHELEKYIANIQKEISRAKVEKDAKKPVEEVTTELESEQVQKMTELVSLAFDIRETLRAMSVGDTDELRNYNKETKQKQEQSMAEIGAEFDRRKNVAKQAVDNAGGNSDELTDEELDTMTSSKTVPIIDKATGKNAVVESINKKSLDPNNIGAVPKKNSDKRDLKRLDVFRDSGLKLEKEATNKVLTISATAYKNVKSIFKDKNVAAMCSGRMITEDDITFAANLRGGIKNFKKRCAVLVKAGKSSKDYKSLKDINNISGTTMIILEQNNKFTDLQKNSENGYVNSNESDNTSDDIQTNGIGTFLLRGASKGIHAIGNLLGGRKKKSKKDPGFAESLLGATTAMSTLPKLGGGNEGSSDNNERMDAQDPNTGEFYKTKKDSSGSIKPDTADPQTKKVMNLIEIKNKAQEKLQNAQIKACEVINKTFDTSSEADSKGGKLTWLQLLLYGTILVKSGLLGKIFNNVVKPIWTNHLKPWITDTAVPWITNTAIPAIGNFVTTAAETIVTGIAKNLPNLIASGIKMTLSTTGTVLDTITGNKTNVGGKTTTDFSGMSDDQTTEITDSKGNKLTVAQLKSGKYDKVYNAQGEEGTLDKNGNWVFKDTSKTGSSYAKTIAAPTVRSLIKGVTTGKAIGGATLVDKASTQMIKKGGLVSKITGLAGKAVAEPINLANDIGRSINNKFQGVQLAKQAAETTAGDAVKEAGVKGIEPNSMTGKVAKKASENITKLATSGKSLLEKLFASSTVLSKLKSVAKTLGIDNVTKWLSGLKEKIGTVIEEALSTGAKKASNSVVGSAIKTVGKFITPIMAVVDFAKGCDKAESMLGVSDTTILEEVACGFSNAICNFLIVPSVYPGSGWIAQKICNIFGDDLTKRQKEADEEYQKYKKQSGSTESKEEYLENTKSISGKIKSKVKGAVNTVKSLPGKALNAAKKGVGFVKDKAVGAATAVKDTAVGAANTVKEKATQVKNSVEQFGSNVATTAKKIVKSDLVQNLGTMVKAASTGDFDTYATVGEKTDGIERSVIGTARTALLPLAGASVVGKKIVSAVKSVGSTVIDIGSDIGGLAKAAFSGDSKSFEQYKSDTKDKGVVGTLRKAIVGIAKIPLIVPLNVVKGVKFVGNKLVNGINAIKTEVELISQDNTQIAALARAGKVGETASYSPNTTDNGAGSFIRKAVANVSKAFYLPVATISKGVNFVKQKVGQVVNAAKAEVVAISEDNSEISSLASSGKITSVATYSPKTNDNGPGAFIRGAVANVSKIYYLPVATITAALNKIKHAIGSVINGVKSIASDASDVWDIAIEGHTSKLWSYSSKADGVAGTISNAIIGIEKFLLTPIAIVRSFFNKIADWVSNIGDWFGKKFSGIKDFLKDPVNGIYNAITGGGSGEGTSSDTSSDSGKGKFGRGFVKQIDPSVSNIRYNSKNDTEYQTIGNSGCGPAAAVNAVKSVFGRGNDNELTNAANYALENGYKETNGGTKPGFFMDYFNKNGLGSQLSYNKSQLANNINSGEPTVLMGKDKNGVNASNPFGKTSHYVTVTGTDGMGNAIVQDPESKYDNQLYDINSLMKNTTLGVSAYGKGKKEDAINSIKGMTVSNELNKIADKDKKKSNKKTKNTNKTKQTVKSTSSNTNTPTTTENQDDTITADDTSTTSSSSTSSSWSDLINNTPAGKALSILLTGSTTTVSASESSDSDSTTGNTSSDGTNKGNTWAFFKNKGFSDAGTAGIMGNLEQESGTDPKMIQGNGKGPAAGIAQWENYNTKSKRWKLLSDYAKSKGKSWTDLDTQLEFLLGELEGKKGDSYTGQLMKKKGGINKLKTATDYKAATKLFEEVFERAGKPMMENRYKYAKNALDKYAGKKTAGKTDGSASGKGKFGMGKFGRAKTAATGSFPTYNLTDRQIKGLANIVGHEQGGKAGRLAEASLMVNQVDLDGKRHTPNDVVKNATSGWFYKGSERYNNPGNPPQDAINAVKTVMVEGKRTLPRYIDEHDCFSDIGSVTNNGSSISKTNRSAYKQFVTKIKNHQGSTYTFYSFPDSESDPFGYISDKMKKKWGDGHYDGDTMVGSTNGTDNSSSDSSSEDSTTTVSSFVDMLSNTMTNSNVGKSLSLLANTNSSSSSNDSNSSDSSSSSSSAVGGSAGNLINIASKEVGYHEKASNSQLESKTANPGHSNYTKYGKWFGLNGPSAAWCNMFVSWCANQAGIPTSVIPKSAGTKDTYAWFQKKNQLVSNPAKSKAGDLVLFTNPSQGIHHIGIVEDTSGGNVHTIEGNSSNVVKRRTYKTSDSSLRIVRPKYADDSTSGSYKADSSKFANVSTGGSYANTRGGNANKPMSRFGIFKEGLTGKYGMGNKATNLKDYKGIVDKVEYNPDLENSKKNDIPSPRYGKGSTGRTRTVVAKQQTSTPVDYTALIKVVISTLATIADNTDKLNTIITILNDKLGVKITQEDVTKVNKESLTSKLKSALLNNTKSSSIDNYQDTINNSSLNTIINTMNALASE